MPPARTLLFLFVWILVSGYLSGTLSVLFWNISFPVVSNLEGNTKLEVTGFLLPFVILWGVVFYLVYKTMVWAVGDPLMRSEAPN